MKLGSIFDDIFHLLGSLIYEEQVGEIGFRDKLSFATNAFQGAMEWEVTFDTFINKVMVGFRLAMVSGTQYKPFFSRAWCVPF